MFAQKLSKLPPKEDLMAELESMTILDLDPCCQKEIEHNKESNRISKALRSVDRSNERLDRKLDIFNSLKSGASLTCQSCNCENQTSEVLMEYSMLQRLRNAAFCGEVINSSSSSSSTSYFSSLISSQDELSDARDRAALAKEKENGAIGSSGGGDDSDLDDFMDDFVTPYEEERREAMRTALQNIDDAKQIGYSYHAEDSIEHISDLISIGTNLIVHFYRDTLLDAKVDLALETLSSRYIGTKFRRLALLPSAHIFLNKWRVTFKDYLREEHGFILVFRDKSLISSISDFNIIGSRDEIYPEEINRFLDQSRALSTDPPLIVMENIINSIRIVAKSKKASKQKGVRRVGQYNSGDNNEDSGNDSEDLDEDDDFDEDIVKYCNEVGCMKQFPHEHIIANKKPSFAGKYDKQEGAEVLAKDVFYKL